MIGSLSLSYVVRTGIAAVLFIIALKAVARRVPALQGVAGSL
jgi:hypothetical protein